MTQYNKAWAALIGAALTIAAQFGLDTAWATPELINTVGSLLTAIAVYVIPNAEEKP